FITLGRNRTLTSFELLTPTNNARVEVKKASTDPIVITWESSNTASLYTWFLDVPSGNFATPVVKLNSDANGTDTKLTLTSGTVDAVAEGAGVAEGDSIDLKWTVRAYEGTDSLTANTAFGIRVVRAKSVGMKELTKDASILVYPNPAKESVQITSSLNLNGAQIEFTNLQGVRVLSTTYNGSEIALNGLAPGVYMVSVQTTETYSTYKLIVE
ncbi:MAG: T9SS type A sorting domain-containing protein, partial [Bacteroidia bacterium]|nr:T9SS type A sorting domain-containing protein [Bacteroidia bacterium]